MMGAKTLLKDHTFAIIKQVWLSVMNVINSIFEVRDGENTPFDSPQPSEAENCGELKWNIAVNSKFVRIVNYVLGIKMAHLCILVRV